MISTPHHIPLVVETRGVGSAQTVESVHDGSVAVVDATGHLVVYAGDAQAMTFSRSTIKPFQALPLMKLDDVSTLGLSEEEIALLCSSHSGEEKHLALVDSVLKKIQCDEHHLQCGCHVPLRFTWQNQRPPAGAIFDQRHNNCSGKHAGFLAYCRLTGNALDTYLDEEHPLQRKIRTDLARAAGLEETRLAVGIDGCSAPNYALPLNALARLYALLARPEAATEGAEALKVLAQAMRQHPYVISGERRSDAYFVEAGQGDWLAKVGAGGVQTISLRTSGWGIAVKIAGGNMTALYCATTAVLEQLGLLTEHARSVLREYIRPAIHNPRGLMTGEWRTVFNLQRTTP